MKIYSVTQKASIYNSAKILCGTRERYVKGTESWEENKIIRSIFV
jgi:hypothetical protein